MNTIIIIHPLQERDLAEDLAKLILSISDNEYEIITLAGFVKEQSRDTPKGWRHSLITHIKQATFTICITTPRDLSLPYFWWAYGASQASENIAQSFVIEYGPHGSEINDSLALDERHDGMNIDSVKKLCNSLLEAIGKTIEENEQLDSSLSEYLRFARIHAPTIKASETSESMWRRKIESCILAGRSIQLPELMVMMYASIGSEKAFNFEIHSLLSEALTESEQFSLALLETDRALKLAPRDLTLLHRRIMIYLHIGDYKLAEKSLKKAYNRYRMLRTLPEFAGLEGRLYSEQFEQQAENRSALQKAIHAYQRAFEANPKSHYVGGNVAILLLMNGQTSAAEEVARKVIAVCRLDQQRPPVDYWNDFSEGAMHLILQDEILAFEAYTRGLTRANVPTARQIDSVVRRGIERIANHVHLDSDILDRIKSELIANR